MIAIPPRTVVLTFETEPDGLGRRRFCAQWLEIDGVYRLDRGPDGKPVGYRRGQFFLARPWTFIRQWRKRGFRVVTAQRFATLVRQTGDRTCRLP